MIPYMHSRLAIGDDERHSPPAARAAEFPQLRRAFERQVTWAADFARVGDAASAREAQLTADAICDELSDD